MMILGHRALAFAATRPSVPLWWVESLTMTVEHHRVSFAVAAERVRFGIGHVYADPETEGETWPPAPGEGGSGNEYP
jgi:hypothetical protein